jgi:tetratricopeptide (TPR) repeat protein
MRVPRVLSRATIGVVLVASLLGPSPEALANERSAALRVRGSNQLFNLDREQAVATFRAAIAADPDDPDAYRALAAALWMSVTFRRGTMTVDSYLGRVSRQNVKMPPPPPEIANEFNQAVAKAVELARARVLASPKSAQARYQLGSAVALRASYAATVDGSVRSAFGAAREAFNEHEQVLQLDPARHDAGLVVGTYRYLVSSLSMPVRWMAYIVGFGGDADRGIRLVEAAASYPGDNQTDARLALVLLYNREERYLEAMAQLAALRAQYPRSRLFWLEGGATALRAGRAREADDLFTEGLTRLATDNRPRMFGEEGLWHLGRGSARAALRRDAEAGLDLNKVLTLESPQWVHGRARLELGKIAARAGNRLKAETDYRAAIPLLDADGDRPSAEEARGLLRQLR